MSARLFEDFRVGETWESDPIPVSAEEIIAFGRDFDPQRMHTDPEHAASGPFKALVASGWHIAALSMRVFVQAGGYGTTPVVGLGVDELRWLAPVRAGDTLWVRREVCELRPSASKPGHGIVRTRVSVRNQESTTVMTLISAGRVPTRAGRGGAAGAPA